MDISKTFQQQILKIETRILFFVSYTLGLFKIFYLTLLSPRGGPHTILEFFYCLFEFIKSSERAARNLGLFLISILLY